MVSTTDGDRTAIGPIEAQDQAWWDEVGRSAFAHNGISVVLDPPESYVIRLPHLPRSPRALAMLIDRLAPIQRRYLSVALVHKGHDGDITVAVAYAERLRSLRAMFASHGLPPPLCLAPDGTSAFDQEGPESAKATRVTVFIALAVLLAIPAATSLGARLLTDRIDRQAAVLANAHRADIGDRRAFEDLATIPTVSARIAAVARRLPDEGAIVAIGDAGGRYVSITVDGVSPDRLGLALDRAATLDDLREVSRTRSGDRYRMTYVGIPR